MKKSETIKFAEKRLADSININDEIDIRYWAAYLDGARAQQREFGHGTP